MPLLGRDQIQFALLLLSVPLQYYVVQRMGSSEVSRTYAISKMVNQLKEIQSRWLRVEPWRKWCQKLLVQLSDGSLLSSPVADEDNGESPAFEVLRYRDKNGHFRSDGRCQFSSSHQHLSTLQSIGGGARSQVAPRQAARGTSRQAQVVGLPRRHHRLGRGCQGTRGVDQGEKHSTIKFFLNP
jgi:hypothetical protein